MKTQRICRLVFVLLASSCLLLEGTSSWKAVVSCQSSPSHIDTVQLLSGSSESFIPPGGTPQMVAITPDATKAVVAEGGNILFLDLTQPITTVISSITTGASLATNVAITPDGNLALVLDVYAGLFFVNMGDLEIFYTLNFGGYANAVAITPDGSTALVGTNTDTFIVNIASMTSTGTVSGEPGAFAIAMAPDGTRAFAINSSRTAIDVIDLSLMSVIASIPIPLSELVDIAVSPDGTLALVTAGSNVVAAVDLETLSVIGTTTSFGSNLRGIAITPDGNEALVADATNNVLYTLDLTQLTELINLSSNGISYITVDTTPVFLAITPDQAPFARFTYLAQGTKFFFDGSSSTSPVGGIKTYLWDFGDGTSRTTSTPNVTHTYSGTGPFTVTLTVVNDGGTSLAVTFTGQTVSNNGSPSARTSQVVSVFATPSTFRGKVHHPRHKRAAIHTWWHKRRNIKEYQIFSHDRKIATIRGSQKPEKKIWLHSSHTHISNGYRHYLHKKYSIRALDAYGNASSLALLHVD